MGVSYSWEHGVDGNGPIDGCPDLSGQYIKRTKQVDLSVLNLDINNVGGAAMQRMAKNQERYVNTDTASIYANGVYAGKGKLTDYSINEGSLSNSSVTDLTYVMENGGPQEEDDTDRTEDPVSRTESITVTRDLKGKSYTIQHDYGVSFGDDFDLVSNHPLYADNDQYKSIDGRLTLAENEANERVFNSYSDYTQYLDLSAYQLEKGWNLPKLQGGCSGAFNSSSSTKDFINGDYSLSSTAILRYTGENIEDEPPNYEVNYTLGYAIKEVQVNDKPKKCATVSIQGSIVGKAGSKMDCSAGGYNNATAAQSGYDEFVQGGKAQDRMEDFFNKIKSSVKGVPTDALKPQKKNSKKAQCQSSVNKGQKNNGTIEFSFEMDNCPGQQGGAGGTQYIWNETTTTSYSFNQECAQGARKITQISVNGSVKGQCGLQIDKNGAHERWNGVSDIFDDKKDAAKTTADDAYNGNFPQDWRLVSENWNKNEYEANGSYTVQYSDAPKNQASPSFTNCWNIDTTSETAKAEPREIETITAAGPISETKGNTLPTKMVRSLLEAVATGNCKTDLDTALDKGKTELNDNQPKCAITALSWTFTKRSECGGKPTRVTLEASMDGIDL